MPSVLYVGLQDDEKVAVFGIDEGSGRLNQQADVPLAGGPSVFALSRDGGILYVGSRGEPAIAAFRMDSQGGLAALGRTAVADAPTFLAFDRTGKFLLIACYQGGYAAVHAISDDGSVGAQIDRQPTATGAHAIATDPSNRFVFVPHIAFVQDNVMEPPKNIAGPNMICQFRFDAQSGRLAPNAPARLEPPERLGPRHYCFHPSLDLAYFSNEQGCSVTAYRLDRATGTLSALQTVSTRPPGFTGRGTCSQIHLTPDARFLYVGNRAPNDSSIAGFAVDAATGRLTPAGHAATEPVPSAFCLDPAGRFLYAAGTASGRLASYRIDPATGALAPIAAEAVGGRPAAVQTVALKG